MAYIGNSPGVASQRVVTTFTATASQTTFTPSSGYTVGYLDVYHNGVKLINGDDYTASNGTTFVLASGAASGDVIEAVAYLPRGLSDGYTRAEADTRYVNASGDTMTGALSISEDAAAVSTLNRTTSDGDIQVFQKNGTTVGSVGVTGGKLNVNSTGSNLVFRVGGTDKVNLDATQLYPATDNAQNLSHPSVRWKNLYLSGGVYLGGTGSANYLDDYEEGTWTPYFYDGGDIGGTYGIQFGSYTKIGSVVIALFHINNTTMTGGNLLRLGGLPFSVSSSVNSMGYEPVLAYGFQSVGLEVWQGTNNQVFRDIYNNTYVTRSTGQGKSFSGVYVYQTS
jgi:hypothetical protein